MIFAAILHSLPRCGDGTSVLRARVLHVWISNAILRTRNASIAPEVDGMRLGVSTKGVLMTHCRWPKNAQACDLGPVTHVSTSKCKPFGHRHGIWIFRYSSGERSSHDNGAGDTEVLGSTSHLCFEIAEVPAARVLSEHFPRATTGFPYCVVLVVFAPQPMKRAHVLAYCTRDTRAFVCVYAFLLHP